MCIRDREIILAVQDDGPGMKQEILDRLFEPFLTRRPGGTGLGMAIVRRTVEVHGGKVGVQSRSGKGTRVEIRLPRGGAGEGVEVPGIRPRDQFSSFSSS